MLTVVMPDMLPSPHLHQKPSHQRCNCFFIKLKAMFKPVHIYSPSPAKWNEIKISLLFSSPSVILFIQGNQEPLWTLIFMSLNVKEEECTILHSIDHLLWMKTIDKTPSILLVRYAVIY